MKRGKIPKKVCFYFFKICNFKKIKTNHLFPVAARAIRQSVENRDFFTQFHVYTEGVLFLYEILNFIFRLV